MPRQLVLFAREPAREAREKGFSAPEAADLFAGFADGWLVTARQTGARLVIASPREDHPAWRRRFAGAPGVVVIGQGGGSFGRRLERVARRASLFGGPVVLVGGDVPPSRRDAARAFSLLESGVGAVLAPASDGGVSLIGLARDDFDLLRAVARRRRDVFEALARRIRERGRGLIVLDVWPDVDGRRSLCALRRFRPLAPPLAPIVRRVLAAGAPAGAPPSVPRTRAAESALPVLRAPPRAA